MSRLMMIAQTYIPIKWMTLSLKEVEAIEKILKNPGGGWIAKNINKRLSLPLSIYLARWGITPNQITFINLLLGLISGITVALGGSLNLLLGGVLFQIVSILDGCDGEVAFLNNKRSRFGSWFDTVGDNLSFIAFVVGVTFSLYQQTHAKWVLILSEIALVSFAILLSIMGSYLLRKHKGRASLTSYEREVVLKSFSQKKGWVATFVLRGKFLIKKAFFALLFSILAILNLPEGIVFFAALGSGAVAIILSLMTLKEWRVRKAATASQATGISR